MKVLVDLLSSKKFIAAVIAIAVAVAAKIGLDPDLSTKIQEALWVFIGAQGFADHGKEAAKITAAAANGSTASSTPGGS